MERKEQSPPVLHKAVSMGVVADTSKSPLPFGPVTFQKQITTISPFGKLDDASNRQNYLASSTITNNSTADLSAEPTQSL